MATDKINNYAIGDNNFESVMLTLDQAFRNKHDCYSFSATALKAGSVIEINGSLYPVTQDVTLPNMTSNKYLMAVPSSSGTFTLLATSTAPTWSDAKQGYYGTSTTANYKYIGVKEGLSIATYGIKNIKHEFINCYSTNELTHTFAVNDEFIVLCPMHVFSGARNSATPTPYMYVFIDGVYNPYSISMASDDVGILMPGRYKIYANTAILTFGNAFGAKNINDAVVIL